MIIECLQEGYEVLYMDGYIFFLRKVKTLIYKKRKMPRPSRTKPFSRTITSTIP